MVLSETFATLLTIVVIDLALAGDNAIVIALAARNVPQALRKRAILWGMFGAVLVRCVMTLIVVWLLKIPGLLAIGGIALLWIGYSLLTDNDAEHEVRAANNFWGAMKTIVIADALMGLDNVLAVAGAARGSFLLVVIGLLISVPIVVWGSQLILRWVDRYPILIYIGAGVLALTSAKMVTHEPLLHDWLAPRAWIVPVVYVLAIVGVLGAGYLVNRWQKQKRQNAQ